MKSNISNPRSFQFLDTLSGFSTDILLVVFCIINIQRKPDLKRWPCRNHPGLNPEVLHILLKWMDWGFLQPHTLICPSLFPPIIRASCLKRSNKPEPCRVNRIEWTKNGHTEKKRSKPPKKKHYEKLNLFFSS